MYWPTGIYGYGINAHCEKKGEHDRLSGNWKGIEFDVFVLTDKKLQHDNDVNMLWCHGVLKIQKEEYKISKGKVYTFQYA